LNNIVNIGASEADSMAHLEAQFTPQRLNFRFRNLHVGVVYQTSRLLARGLPDPHPVYVEI
jgi:hypothetical protein